MKGLLLIAHGSSRQASNDEIKRLAERLRRKTPERFQYIAYAFLEMAQPSISEGIQKCLDVGVNELYVLPYFLAKGKHVAEDIPAEISRKRLENPRVKIHLCGHLGRSEEAMADLLLYVAEQEASG